MLWVIWCIGKKAQPIMCCYIVCLVTSDMPASRKWTFHKMERKGFFPPLSPLTNESNKYNIYYITDTWEVKRHNGIMYSRNVKCIYKLMSNHCNATTFFCIVHHHPPTHSQKKRWKPGYLVNFPQVDIITTCASRTTAKVRWIYKPHHLA